MQSLRWPFGGGAQRRRRRISLQLEQLERRDLPTTFTAAQLLDAGEYMLALINRARTNPVAEAARYGIDLNEGLAAGTIPTTPVQPLAPNPALLTAIEGHLQVWLGSTAYWAVSGGAGAPNPHDGLGDGDPGTRIAAAGYGFANWWGENLAAAWQTNPIADLQAEVDQLERNLFVDSSVPGRGHRLNLLDPNFQEAGVALVSGLVPNGAWAGANAVLAGQDFAADFGIDAAGAPGRADPTAGGFVTGVVYQDQSANGSYDIGEGIGGGSTIVSWHSLDPAGATWNADGSAAVDATGGYVTAKLAPGPWAITISGGALLAPQTVDVTVGTINAEADFVVDPSNITGPGSQPPTPPSIAPIAKQQNSAWDTVALQVSAAGADSFTATGLPAGLTIDNTGLISGTIIPGAAGSHRVTVTAYASGVPSTPMTFTWTVKPPTITLSGLPTPQDAVAYSATLTAAGGTGPYTFSLIAGALPLGLTLTAAGTISGTPRAAGLASFWIRARDASTGAGPFQAVQHYTLNVAPPTLVMASVPLAMQVGAAAKLSLGVTGGIAPYYYYLVSGHLPAGVTLSLAGVLSGAPTAGGTFTFAVRARDSSRGTGPFAVTQTFTLVVAPPTLAIATTSLPGVPVGLPFTQTISGSGGTGPRSFSIVAGSLPHGVYLLRTGLLYGTPTVAGAYSFTVQMTDASTGTGPYYVQQSLQMVVQQATQISFVAPIADSATYRLGVVQVQVLDQFGNPYNGAVTLRPQNPDGTWSYFLAGSVTRATTVNGVATFSTLLLSPWTAKSATGPRSYTIVASVGSLSVTSNTFNVGTAV
jgi:hypothetical protein